LQLAGDIGKTLTEEALKRTDVAIQLAKTAIVSSSPLVAAYLMNSLHEFIRAPQCFWIFFKFSISVFFFYSYATKIISNLKFFITNSSCVASTCVQYIAFSENRGGNAADPRPYFICCKPYYAANLIDTCHLKSLDSRQWVLLTDHLVRDSRQQVVLLKKSLI
jgi:hypothetical protein